MSEERKDSGSGPAGGVGGGRGASPEPQGLAASAVAGPQCFPRSRFQASSVVLPGYVCSCCGDISNQPVVSPLCQHMYGRGCANKHLSGDDSVCMKPGCGKPLAFGDLKPVAEFSVHLGNFYADLLITCKHESRGCGAKVAMKDREDHESKCSFRPVKCAHPDCDRFENAQDLAQHVLECEHQEATCDYACHGCSRVLTLATKESHREKCDYRPISCPLCTQEHGLAHFRFHLAVDHTDAVRCSKCKHADIRTWLARVGDLAVGADSTLIGDGAIGGGSGGGGGSGYRIEEPAYVTAPDSSASFVPKHNCNDIIAQVMHADNMFLKFTPPPVGSSSPEWARAHEFGLAQGMLMRAAFPNGSTNFTTLPMVLNIHLIMVRSGIDSGLTNDDLQAALIACLSADVRQLRPLLGTSAMSLDAEAKEAGAFAPMLIVARVAHNLGMLDFYMFIRSMVDRRVAGIRWGAWIPDGNDVAPLDTLPTEPDMSLTAELFENYDPRTVSSDLRYAPFTSRTALRTALAAMDKRAGLAGALADPEHIALRDMLYEAATSDASFARVNLALGDMFTHGTGGVDRDERRAVRFYQRAANMGNLWGLARLGEAYFYGRGVAKSSERACGYWRSAADAGHADAAVWLGDRYYWGDGVVKSYPEAIRLWRSAADQGHAQAQSNLADRYNDGCGIPRDFERALELWRKAASQGIVHAMHYLATAYFTGRGTEKNVESALKWWTSAADAGHADAQANLGDRYYHGDGVDKDINAAVSWWTKAANQNHPIAMCNLARRYMAGEGVDADPGRAFSLIQGAANTGNIFAISCLADCYLNGEGVDANPAAAVSEYLKCADKGHTGALYQLGVIFLDGREGVPADKDRAFEMLTRAADAGREAAVSLLADRF